MNSRTRNALTAAGVIAAAALAAAVLYGKWGSDVHESGQIAAAEPEAAPAAGAGADGPSGLPESLPGVRVSEETAPAPQSVFFDADGAEKTLADFQGQFVVLNLWATWCAPCVAELPALARAQEMLGGDVLILPVDMEQKEAAEISAFLADKGAGSLPTYIDRDYGLMRAFEAFSVGLPYTIFIDAEGNQVATASGPQEWDDPEAVEYIRAMAGG